MLVIHQTDSKQLEQKLAHTCTQRKKPTGWCNSPSSIYNATVGAGLSFPLVSGCTAAPQATAATVRATCAGDNALPETISATKFGPFNPGLHSGQYSKSAGATHTDVLSMLSGVTAAGTCNT